MRSTLRPLVVHVTTVPMSLTFLRELVRATKAHGLSVEAITSPGTDADRFAEMLDIRIRTVNMPRRITPLRDALATLRITKILQRVRPAIVHAHTPKGGFLGMVASRIARVPVRIYHMRGLPVQDATGLNRSILRFTERLACRLASRVICVSASIRTRAIAMNLAPPEKILVLAKGSGQGVDAEKRFNPASSPEPEESRRKCDLPVDARVLGYVGRIVRDKGIVELEAAWRILRERFPGLYLLVVGPEEERDAVPEDVMVRLRSDPRVRLTGMNWETPPLYVAMDVVAFPSRREGFPNVPLEAAAMERPVVAASIPECAEAIEDGRTGTLVPVGDVSRLAEAVAAYLEDASLARAHGQAARKRVLRDFRPERIAEETIRLYENLLAATGTTIPGNRTPLSKRAFDILAAAIAMVALSPIILMTAVLIRLFLGSPVIFRQKRPGIHGIPFTMYKFRTMVDAKTAEGEELPDAERMTWLGRVLRMASLDELPTLWNVIKGDMSLVGPRPLLMEYLPLYSAEQMRRHDVLPGITGWAQVNGRNAISWDQKFAYDLWYVDNRTLAFDLKILWMTVTKVLAREGISQEGHVTTERFRGES